MRTASSLVVAVVALSPFLVACGGGGGSGGNPNSTGGPAQGTMKISVTDAPFPFSYVTSASVTIDEVRVHERGSDAWTVVFTGSRTIDLVPLENGVTQVLVDAAVPPGAYDQVRLIVDAGEVVLGAGAVVRGGDHDFTTAKGNLLFPSGAQTGIKIGIENDIVVTTHLSGDLVLDFDLARNFVFNGPVSHAPGVGRVIFTPSVRATNESVAGSLRLTAVSDELTPLDPTDDMPLSGATVLVFDGGADTSIDAPVATGSTGADGVAVISLPPGTYQVVVEASSHESATVGGLVVTLANVTGAGAILLTATGQVSGVVMNDGATPGDTSDDVVVAGATVEVHSAGDASVLAVVSTDSSGAFQVTGLAAGSYDLFVSATGFAGGSDLGVSATLGGPGSTIVLAALTSQVTGTVTDSGGAAIADASVTVTNAAGVQVASTTTAADGTYSATLGTGAYVVTFTSGASTTTATLTVVGESPPNVVTLDATL